MIVCKWVTSLPVDQLFIFSTHSPLAEASFPCYLLKGGWGGEELRLDSLPKGASAILVPRALSLQITESRVAPGMRARECQRTSRSWLKYPFLFNVFVASALTVIDITFFLPSLFFKDHFLYFWYITGDSLLSFTFENYYFRKRHFNVWFLLYLSLIFSVFLPKGWGNLF